MCIRDSKYTFLTFSEAILHESNGVQCCLDFGDSYTPHRNPHARGLSALILCGFFYKRHCYYSIIVWKAFQANLGFPAIICMKNREEIWAVWRRVSPGAAQNRRKWIEAIVKPLTVQETCTVSGFLLPYLQIWGIQEVFYCGQSQMRPAHKQKKSNDF